MTLAVLNKSIIPDGPWMHTASGKAFPFMEPGIADIDIHDIAHSLSMQCRFNGHIRWFYSVAEHSVNVSNEVDEQYAMAALLHDASEAYIGDLVSPLKAKLPDYQEIEHRLDHTIRRRYQIESYDPIQDDEVKRADRAMCVLEGRALLPNPSLVDEWDFSHNPLFSTTRKSHVLRGLSPEAAKMSFLKRFDELMLARRKA